MREHPWDYPGRAIPRPLVLTGTGQVAVGWEEVGPRLDAVLARCDVPLLGSRRVVVAVGSNADAATLRRKLRAGGASSVVPVVPGVLAGVSVAHSAHVSRGGYVAAAPVARPSGAARIAALWLEARQLAVLDESEPNYVRTPVSSARYPLALTGIASPPVFDLYRSVWGVLRVGGSVVTARRQVRLHRVLSADPGLAQVPWHDPSSALAALLRREVQVAVRKRWATSGSSVEDGLVAHIPLGVMPPG